VSSRRRLAVVLGVVAVALVVALLLHDPVRVPVVEVGGPGAVPQSPVQLDEWLAEQEQRHTDITPGTEKHIQWADPDRPARTPLSLVYLHGYSATRQELSPVYEQVADELGANLFLTRLRGHGRTGEAFAEATLQEWAEDGVDAIRVGQVLGERVVVVGTSTGATLALWLAAQGADVDALVLMSPNFAPRASGSEVLLWPGRQLIVRVVLGTHREWEPDNELFDRYWTHRYPARALFPMMELVELVRRTDLSPIQAPALVLYSSQDPVVQTERIPGRMEELTGTVRLVEIRDAEDHHVLAGRAASPSTTGLVVGEVLRFLEQELGG